MSTFHYAPVFGQHFNRKTYVWKTLKKELQTKTTTTSLKSTERKKMRRAEKKNCPKTAQKDRHTNRQTETKGKDSKETVII